MKQYHQLIASLCLSLAAYSAQASESFTPQIGKLFLQTEKRISLERQRLYNIHEAENVESDTLQLNGVVRRSSGRNSVWLNNQMRTEDGQTNKANSIAVQTQRHRPGEASLELEKGQTVPLRVGEAINRSTQERKDVVAPNAVRAGTIKQN